MLKNRREAARKVADHLFALEEAIDIAIARAAELNAAIPTARTHAKVSAVMGQEAMTVAAKALGLMVEARQQIVETHHCLDRTKTDMGLREMSFGDLAPKPNYFTTGQAEPDLKVVGKS